MRHLTKKITLSCFLTTGILYSADQYFTSFKGPTLQTLALKAIAKSVNDGNTSFLEVDRMLELLPVHKSSIRTFDKSHTRENTRDLLKSLCKTQRIIELSACFSPYARDTAEKTITFMASEDKKNAYLILDLEYNTEFEQVKKHWQRLARLIHPDRCDEEGMDMELARKRFGMVGFAFNIVKIASRKKPYEIIPLKDMHLYTTFPYLYANLRLA